MSLRITQGAAEPMGLRLDARGANIAVWAPDAERVALCLFDDEGRETARLTLTGRTGGVRHGHVEGLAAGALYGLRAWGPFAPQEGHRFNPAKLLLDPWALALTGEPQWDEVMHCGDAAPDPRDSAAAMPKCIAVEDLPRIDPAERPRHGWSETVIYEAQVRALTRLHPGIPEEIRGTYEALGHPAVVEHLSRLGVTALELLPIQAFMDEPHLVRRGLRNHWGYNTCAFFAPSPRFMGPKGAAGLREAIAALHAAGIEVLLDVVYNHTAESDDAGPTLAWRGLCDARAYRHAPDAPAGGYVNHTGCGNTFDLSEPFMERLMRESLVWWAERMGVDGFRFDLAPVLGRGKGDVFEADGALSRLAHDPVLSTLKLIAEPWDIGPEGYRLGGFPSPWAEWNDRFRDGSRSFWMRRPGGAQDLAGGLLGSAEAFDHDGRRPFASVNFVAAHDGFTLADATLFAERRNEANGEENRDGHAGEISDPMGPEGENGDPEQDEARRRRRRSLILTVFAAQGVPMLRAGDELAQSQGGNNNAYCQDNETTWIDWEAGDAELAAFAGRAAALRARLGALRQGRFLHGEPEADGLPNAQWFGLDGGVPDWGPDLAGLALVLRGEGEAPAAVILNAGEGPAGVAPPPAGEGWSWRLALDASQAEGGQGDGPPPSEIPAGAAWLLEGVPDSAAQRLADRLGVFRRYHEADGTPREVPAESRAALVRAMGLPADDAGAEAELARRSAPRRLPEEIVVEADAPGALAAPDFAWEIALEDGGALHGAAGEAPPALPMGLHRLRAGGEAAWLAAAPAHAPSTSEAAGKARPWGVTGAVYGLVSRRSLGRGDFEDLAAAAEALAPLGADFIGVNPVHALGVAHHGFSPYAPGSRTALDPRCIAPDRLPEFAGCAPARAFLAGRREALDAANAERLTDPALQRAVSGELLRALFAAFEAAEDPARREAFAVWLAEKGEGMARFALFEALSELHGEDWRGWPAPLRDPQGAAARDFAIEHPDALRFHAWLQWIAEAQLDAAQARAEAAGMGLGLYLDIAVGVRPGGAETWGDADAAFAAGVSLGAPPDAMNAQGQVWALSPLNPEGLRRTGYAAFREMLRATMARAGAVRIDHVLGLDRAFWAPEGGAPGGYVRYPREMLLALVRIEAVRAGCVVVGEDLGTVPEGLRDRLAESGLHGCAILQFEGDAKGFRAPADFPEKSLTSFGTHDTPTLAGWWEGTDIALRLSVGHLDEAGAAAAQGERDGARRALGDLLVRAGRAPEGFSAGAPPTGMTPALRDAVLGLLAAGDSALMAVQLDDVWLERDMQNLPGTVDEAPNWRLRHAVGPEGMGEDADLRRVAEVIAAARR